MAPTAPLAACPSLGWSSRSPCHLVTLSLLRRRRRVGRLDPDRLGDELAGGHRSWVERRLAPGHFQRQLGKIDDAAIAAETTLVVRRAHEDAVHRTGIDTQRAEHALGVVDLEAVDAKALAHWVLDLLDVDAIDRTGAGALVAAYARHQVEAVEAAVARLDRHRQFGVLEALGEGLALERLQEVPQGDIHSLRDRLDRHNDVREPGAHGPSLPGLTKRK